MKQISHFSFWLILSVFAATASIVGCSPQETPENNPISAVSKSAPNQASDWDSHFDIDAASCSCVNYVKAKKALNGSVNYQGHAYQMGLSLLPNNGYYKINSNTPMVGDIIIYKPTYGGGINTTSGHTGIIQSVTNVTGGKKVNVRGAAQGGTQFTDANCTNVSNAINSTITSTNFSKIEYWRK